MKQRSCDSWQHAIYDSASSSCSLKKYFLYFLLFLQRKEQKKNGNYLRYAVSNNCYRCDIIVMKTWKKNENFNSFNTRAHFLSPGNKNRSHNSDIEMNMNMNSKVLAMVFLWSFFGGVDVVTLETFFFHWNVRKTMIIFAWTVNVRTHCILTFLFTFYYFLIRSKEMKILSVFLMTFYRFTQAHAHNPFLNEWNKEEWIKKKKMSLHMHFVFFILECEQILLHFRFAFTRKRKWNQIKWRWSGRGRGRSKSRKREINFYVLKKNEHWNETLVNGNWMQMMIMLVVVMMLYGMWSQYFTHKICNQGKIFTFKAILLKFSFVLYVVLCANVWHNGNEKQR